MRVMAARFILFTFITLFIFCTLPTFPNNYDSFTNNYHPQNSIYDDTSLINYLSDQCDNTLLNDPDAKIIIAEDINQLSRSYKPTLSPSIGQKTNQRQTNYRCFYYKPATALDKA